MDYRIQTICFPKEEKHLLCTELFYKGESGYLDREEETLSLAYGQKCDLMTYLNAVSWAKWKTFTKASVLTLHLQVEGPVEVSYVGTSMIYREIELQEFACRKDMAEGKREITYTYPETNHTLVSAKITALGDVKILGGYFTVACEEADLNPVQIAIATTTCRKEDYIRKNVALMKAELLQGEDEIKDHLDVHVVDNGRTLKEEEIAGDHVYFHPNPNTGGSGGFARGMIETLYQKTPATHVLLMDDDVLILPESIRRTYHLLRLMKDEYKDRFINGAMLRYERPEFQHEDLGTLSQNKLFVPLKPPFDHTDLHDVLKCEGYYNAPCTYAAWWYCCIPMETVKRVGLPMPFFVRGDDSEYSLRSGAKFISMNGICLWHLGFSLKFNAAMDIYQQFRNLHIVQASSDFMKDINLHHTYRGFFKYDLRKFNYDACELYLKAMEDFLKGPSFIETADGEAILKANSAMNEKTEPLKDHPEIPIRILEECYEDEKQNFVRRFYYRLCWHLTDNGQRFSRGKQKNRDLPVAAFDFSVQLTKQGGVSQYAAVNPFLETVAIRKMDVQRYRSIKKRYKQLEKEYEKNLPRLTKEYHEAKAYLTSEAFWRKYLGLPEQAK